MRIVIVTDAWAPQVNGVVNAIRNLHQHLVEQGHDLLIISPDQFPSLPCPTYQEIRLGFVRASGIGKRILEFAPDAIHLMTEGPLGLAARRWCVRNEIPFTSAYCTNFPDYAESRTGISKQYFWPYFRWFHHAARAVMGSTPSVLEQLRGQGITHVRHWGRGVDLKKFSTSAVAPPLFSDLQRPIQLYVGRVAIEKNLPAFLSAKHPGSKVVVGDGPARSQLQLEFPDVHFLGKLHGAELAGAYAGADVFVFPSRTDTFGVVMIEALACGTPVAAYKVPGPIDIVTDATGALHDDLDQAIGTALTRNRSACAAYGRSFSWSASAEQFLNSLSQFKMNALVTAG